MITWEEVYNKYYQVYPDDYFLNILKLALDSYPELVSKTSWGNSITELKLSGREIYQKFKSGSLDMKIMGREKGLSGEPIKRDMESGKWKSQKYETSSKEKTPNDNWFSIQEFIKLIEGH